MKIYIYEFGTEYDDGDFFFNNLSRLSLLKDLDVLRRLRLAANKDCEINIVLLLPHEDSLKNSQFSTQESQKYNLLSEPRVITVHRQEASKWPQGDFVFFPQDWLDHRSDENLPGWMQGSETPTGRWQYSDKVHGIQPFYISGEDTNCNLDGPKKQNNFHRASQLLDMGWSVEDIRMLITVNSDRTDHSLKMATDSINHGKKVRNALIERCGFKKSITPLQPIEVLLGGFHQAVNSGFALDLISSQSVFNQVASVISEFISPILEQNPKAFKKHNELVQFFDVCQFALFPQDYLEPALPALPKPQCDLIYKWKHKRIITIPIQVDGKIKDRLEMTVDKASDKNKVCEMAQELQKVKSALGHQPPAKIIYEQKKILSLQSKTAEQKRKNRTAINSSNTRSN